MPIQLQLHTMSRTIIALTLILGYFSSLVFGLDVRNIQNGQTIPLPSDYKYADQPYIIPLDDGTWFCVMTIGTKGEVKGSKNYSIATTSVDLGKTWSEFVTCNTTYAIPFKSNFGRLYSITTRHFTYSDDKG